MSHGLQLVAYHLDGSPKFYQEKRLFNNKLEPRTSLDLKAHQSSCSSSQRGVKSVSK